MLLSHVGPVKVYAKSSVFVNFCLTVGLSILNCSLASLVQLLSVLILGCLFILSVLELVCLSVVLTFQVISLRLNYIKRKTVKQKCILNYSTLI